MNHDTVKLTALFTDEHKAAQTIEALKNTSWTLTDVHGPLPSDKISQAMQIKTSGVGWFTLAGGILGFFSGYLLAAFTASRWGLIVGGKPILAYIPFFIVGFEFTILFSILGNVTGLIVLMKLPAFGASPDYHSACSGQHFGIVAACKKSEEKEMRAFLISKGGEIPST